MPSKNATKLPKQIVPTSAALAKSTTTSSMVWHALNEELMMSSPRGVESLNIRSEDLEMEVGLLAATYQDDASCTMFIGVATEREENEEHATTTRTAGDSTVLPPGHATSLQLQVLAVETDQQRDRALSENGLWSRASTTSSPTGGVFVVNNCVSIQVDVALYVKAGCTTRGSIRMLISSEGYNHGNTDGPTNPFIQARISIPTAEKEYEGEVQSSIDTLCKDALDGQMILLPLVGAVVEAMSNVPVTSANGCWGVCMRCSQRNVRLGLPKTPGAVLEDPVLATRTTTTTTTTSSSAGGAVTNLGKGWKCAECDSSDVVYLPSVKTVPPEDADSSPCSFCLCEERVLIYMPCGDRCCVSCFERLCDSAIGAKEVYKPCQDEVVRTSWSAMREKGKDELGGLLPPVDYPFTPDQPSRLLKRGVTIVCPNHKGCAKGLITDLTLFKLLPIRTLSRYNAFALHHALLHEEQPVKFDDEGTAADDGLTSPYGVLYATKCPLPQCHGSLHTSTQFKGMMVCPYCHGAYCHRCGVPPTDCECHDVYDSIATGFSKLPITAVKHLGLPTPSVDVCSAALASRGAAASNMGVFDTFFYNIPLDPKALMIRLPQQLSRKGTAATRALDKKITFSEVEKEFKKASVEQSLGRKFAGAGSGDGSTPSTTTSTNVPSAASSGESGDAVEDTHKKVANSNFRMISSDTVLVLHWCAALIRKRTKEMIKLTHTKPKWKSIRVNDPILAALQLVEKLEFDPKYELTLGSPSVRDASLHECWRYIKEYPSEHKQKPNQLTRPEYFRNFKGGFTEQQALLHLVRMCFRTIAVVVVFRGVSFTVNLPCDLPAHCNVTSHVFLQAVSSACPLVNPRSVAPFSPETFLSDPDRAKPPSDLAPFTHLIWQLVRFVESRSGVPDDKPPAPFAVGWADILQMVVADTLLSGSTVGCTASPTAGRWRASPQHSLYMTAGAALSTMPIAKDEECFGSFTTALSAPVHANIIHPGSTVYVIEHFIKDLNYSAAAVAEVEAVAFMQVSNTGPTEGLTRITRKCPNCSSPTVHYLGHGCHIMECASRRCGIQWCYACGLGAPQHKCPSGCSLFCQYEVVYKKAPATPERDPATEIRVRLLNTEEQIREGLLLFSHVQGRSCSCTICPDCRPHMPCSICSGCPVCTGVGIGAMGLIVEGEDDEDSDDDSDDSGSDDESFEEADDDVEDLLFLDDLFEM